MSKRVLILRPQPGADETALRARALGLEPLLAPLFTIRPLDWEAPDAGAFYAVMMTSANAARFGGAGLGPFLRLPCYAVGERTADAARDAGFLDVRTGPSDGAALAALMVRDGIARAFHPCGRDRTDISEPGLTIVPVAVYAADAADALPVALDGQAVALLHSPRAARRFAELAGARSAIRIAAISPATAEAAGPGWASVHVAAAPRDEALLELAAKLCQNGGR